MTAVPVFIVEEHHEAFLAWHQARLAGTIEATGNHLLHVDFHIDLAPPVLCRPIHHLAPSLEAIASFTYGELTIATFIVPAIYQRLINRVHWLSPAAPAALPSTREMYVRTYKGEGRLFVVAHGRPRTVTALLGDAVGFEMTQGSANDRVELGESVILDIDLDYFSLDAYSNRDFRVAVTPDEYARFVADPYHPLRAIMGCQPEQAEGQRFIVFNRLAHCDAPAPLKATPAVIQQRADSLAACLRRCGVRPRLIDISRSWRTGYTPQDQVESIEEVLLETLRELYQIEVVPPAPTRPVAASLA